MSRWARPLTGRTREVLLLGIVVSLGFAVALQWDAIRTFDWRLSWLPFLGAMFLFAFGPLAGGTSFWLVLRDLAPRAPFGVSLWVWERSFAARYIPSGALTVAVRLHERQRLGASRAQMLSATAYEQLVASASAAVVSLAAFAAAGRRPPVVAIVVLAVVVAVTAAVPPFAAWRSRRRDSLRAGGIVVVRPAALAAAGCLSLGGWLVAGAATWLFVEGIGAGGDVEFLFLLGAYSFAWLVGFVIPIAPSGLGAREATLVALLAPAVGAGPATAIAVGLRLANIGGDFLAIGAIETAMHVSGRRSKSGTCVTCEAS